jgi:hypothetical protein
LDSHKKFEEIQLELILVVKLKEKRPYKIIALKKNIKRLTNLFSKKKRLRKQFIITNNTILISKELKKSYFS